MEEPNGSDSTPLHPGEKELFLAARELEDPVEREAWLREACAGDAALLARVMELLETGDEDEDEFLEPGRQRLDEVVSAVGRELRDERTVGEAPAGPPGDRTVAAMLEVGLAEKEGDTIDRYKLLQRIGEGGGGVVYMAQQTEPVRRKVALKIIKLGMDTREVVTRFRAERQALAMMDHPNISKVFDAGATEGGRPYFVMELVRGIPITRFCDENMLDTKARLELFIQVCEAVQHAHQKGIIHRDLKPGNILVTMLEDRPLPKIIDFGIAKATQQDLTDKTLFTRHGHFIGTPAYMSPEQASMTAYDIDTRSDIYSLGALLYELLTSEPLFDHGQLMKAGIDEIRRVIAEEEPPKPSTRIGTMEKETLTRIAASRCDQPASLCRSLHGELDWIVMKALEKDRRRRYETANGFALDLRRFLDGEPVVAAPPGIGYKAGKFIRRHRTGLVVAAMCAALLLAGTAASTWQAVRATRAEQLAGVEAERARLAAMDATEAAARAREAEHLATLKAAEEKAAREEAEDIATFLQTLLASPDPERGAREITVAETLDAAAGMVDSRFAKQPERRARIQQTLGKSYFQLGLQEEAAELLEKAFRAYVESIGPDHPDTVWCHGNLAVVYRNTGRLDESVRILEEVLDHYIETLGKEDLTTLMTMDNLASSYSLSKREREALELREEIVEISKRTLGPTHSFSVTAQSHLLLSRQNAGHTGELIAESTRLLEQARATYGEGDSRTVGAMARLASAYMTAGYHQEARQLQQEVVEFKKRLYGPEHPSTLRMMSNLAKMTERAGEIDQAVSIAEQVLEACRKVHGPVHQDTLSAMKSLAFYYGESGRRDEALGIYRSHIELCRKELGDDDPATLRARLVLCDVLFRPGHQQPVLEELESIVTRSKRAHGDTHPLTVGFMHVLAVRYTEADEEVKSLELFAEVLPGLKAVYGPENEKTLAAMTDLAGRYWIAGRHEEALPLQEESLRIKKDVLPPHHRYTRVALNNMVDILTSLGRHEEALEHAEALLAMRRKHEGDEDSRTLHTFRRLSNLGLEVAVRMRWEKRQEDYAALRTRLLAATRDWETPVQIERIVRAACLAPIPDEGERKEVLALARHGLEQSKGGQHRAFATVGMGAALYRNGEWQPAIEALGGLEDSDWALAAQTAGVIRAMSLFAAGETDSAHALLEEIRGRAEPVPGEPGGPVPEIDRDRIAFSLMYHEAEERIDGEDGRGGH